MGFPQRTGYWSAGLVLVLVAALLGVSGHGLPALGLQMQNGEAWLANVANRSVSLIDGFSGKASTQAQLPGMRGPVQVTNGPSGAVVTDQHGRMTKVSDDDFTTTTPIRLFGADPAAVAAGNSTLYAVDPSAGLIQQLDASGPRLAKVGPQISVHLPVTSPVVAADGSLYFAIPRSGDAGHVSNGRLSTIKGAGQPSDRLQVVLAGTVPVAADLTAGTVTPLGAGQLAGRARHLPGGFVAAQVTGSDTADGLIGAVSATAVDSINAVTGATSRTALPVRVTASATAMVGSTVVIINSAHSNVVIVNTATHKVRPPVTLPGGQVPNELTVRDRLVFVNGSDGPSALVINHSGGIRRVVKYTGPPPPVRHAPVPAPQPKNTPAPSASPEPSKTTGPGTGKSPSPSPTPTPSRPSGPARRPGAPTAPQAIPGSAAVTLSWGAAAANNSAITSYQVSWTGGDSSTGQATTSGAALGTLVKNLSNGVSYVFSISAVNGKGQGPTARTQPVTPSSSVPGAPSGLTATASQPDGSVALSWMAADNGFNIASYTVWSVAAAGARPTPVQTNVTGTSVTVGPSQGLVAGTSEQFEVSAVNAAGATGAMSPLSAAVTPFLAPTAPTVHLDPVPQDGKSATLSVACPASCQQGRPPATYQVSLSPSAPSANATADASGAAVSVPLTGLTANTSYTASVTVTDTAGATGPAAPVTIATPGPPVVSGVTASASGLTLAGAATVNDGGLTTTCSVTANGSTQSGSCSGSISVGVPTYNTSYTVTFTATNIDGSSSGSATVQSGLKTLTADARTAFGTCPVKNPPKFCGGNSHMEPNPAPTENNGAPLVMMGTQETAECWNTGIVDHGTISPWTSGSNLWVQITGTGNGWMSILWFPDPNSVTSGLPHC